MKFRKRVFALLIVVGLSVAAGAIGGRGADIRDGESLIRAMHARYKGSWYNTLTFTQKSTTYKPDGTTSSEIWHEAAWLPGRLRLDIGSLADGNGAIVANGTLTTFRSGKIAATRPLVHMLLLLGFDVYAQEPQTTIDQIKGQGFDMTKLHEDTWQGEPVYVVGADKDDSKSKQFWIEKRRLLFLRLIEPTPQDATRISDTRFLDYRKLAVGWVAAQVDVYTQGKRVFGEEYSDIETNPKLDPSVFDTTQFTTRHWEKEDSSSAGEAATPKHY